MSFLKKLFGEQPEPSEEKFEEGQAPPGMQMETLAQQLVVEPFAKLNHWRLPDGGKRIRAYLLMERRIEGAQTGVAIDGSGSMMGAFGQETLTQVRNLTEQEWGALIQMGLARQHGNQVEIININDPQTLGALVEFGVLKQSPPGENIVQEQARQMTAYLSKFDADGGTTVIYWATGDGRQIEVVGDLTAEQCPTYQFPGPEDFGSETHLLPALKYFAERFEDAEWGIYVFISDGALHDLESVKRYCTQLARDIHRSKRNDLKLVLIGVGDEIDEGQMEELDDLETGTPIDLWDHKIATEMRELAEIFAEVVSENIIVVPGDGIIRDSEGNIVQDYRDTGLPALMWFDLPPGSKWFTLEVGGQVVAQPLEAGVEIPTTQAVESELPPPSSPPAEPASTPPAAEPAQPVATVTLEIEPSDLDFGTVTNWKGELASHEIQLRNPGGQSWSGTVQSTVPWLEVSPTDITCPANGEVMLTIGLSPEGSRLPARHFNAPDAVVIEGGGQKLEVGAQLSTKS